jgi:hypothetical protein
MVAKIFVSLAIGALFASGASAHASAPEPLPEPASAPIESEQSQDAIDSWSVAPEANTVLVGGPKRTEFSFAAERGTAIRDAVTLSNFGDTAKTFRLYGVDAVNNDDGRIEYLSDEQLSGDVGSWVTFAQDSVVVAAHTQTTVALEIRVPDAVRSGDHVGAVMTSNEGVASEPGQQTVTLDRRVGTRLVVRVAGDVVVDLAVSNVRTTYRHALNPADGVAQVSFEITNSGNVRVVGTADVTLKGPFGIAKRTVALGAVPELLPGETITMSTDVAHVAAAMMVSTSVAVQVSRVVDLGVVQVAVGKGTTFAPPISVLLAILSLLVVAIVLRVRRRRRPAMNDSPNARRIS